MSNRLRTAQALTALLMAVAGGYCATGISPVAAQADTQLQVSAEPSLYPAFDVTISDYVTRCTAGTPVQVTVSAPPDMQVKVDEQPPQTRAFTAPVSLTAGQSFSVTATSSGASTATYYVRCLPSDFPGWTTQRSGAPQAEWYMVAPFNRTDFQPAPPGVSPNYLAIFDTNGTPVWWMKSEPRPLDFHLLSNGNVVWTRFDEPPGSEEWQLDGTLVRTITGVGAAVAADDHEILLLPNGNYLILAQRFLPGYEACGQSNLTIIDSGLQEIAPSGSLVWSWFASDHIPLSEVPSAWCNPILTSVTNGQYDVYHANSAEPDGDGFVLSFRHLDAVYRINKADGSISWKLGGTTRPESLSVVGDPAFDSGGGFGGQHDARVLSDGSLTVHDNGYHSGSLRTVRAVRYAIDPGTKTATLLEQVSDPGSVQSAVCCGSARKLPGGDWVMSWGDNDLVTEVTPSGTKVFSLMFDSSLFSYRAAPVLPGVLSRADLRAGMDAQHPRASADPQVATLPPAPLVPALENPASSTLLLPSRTVLRSSRNLRMSKRGVVAITLGCQGSRPCKGTVSLLTVKAIKASKHVLKLGSGRFSMSGGERSKVKIRLSKRSIRLVRRFGSLQVRVRLTPSQGSRSDYVAKLK